jgi:hypothetical protein
MGVGFFVLSGFTSFAGVSRLKTLSASARKSNSPSRGLPRCPARASRMANPVSLSSVRLSIVDSRTSSAVRCSFSLSPARSSARSSAKVCGSRLTMARSKTRNCAGVKEAGAFATMHSNVASRLFRNSSRRVCSASCSTCSRSNCCLRSPGQEMPLLCCDNRWNQGIMWNQGNWQVFSVGTPPLGSPREMCHCFVMLSRGD